MNSRKHLIILGVLIFTALSGSLFLMIFPNKTTEVATENEFFVLEDDESTPLGIPSILPSVYKSGYGITWTSEENKKTPTYYSDLDNSVELTIIGNVDNKPILTGLTRKEAENIVGSTLTKFNNVRISSLNSNSKGFYKTQNDLVILYYDTQPPGKVLFSVKMDNKLASKTKYFTSPNLNDYIIEDFENMTMDLLNAVRVAYGQTPLVIDSRLAVVSRIHSQTMVSDNYFAHINKAGLSPRDRLNAVEVPFTTYSEALTAGTWTPMDVINTWMNSQLHREIILGDYTSGGIGISTGESTYGIYVTLNVTKN